MPGPEVVDTGKLEENITSGASCGIGLGSIFGFLQLVRCRKLGQKIGELAVTDKVQPFWPDGQRGSGLASRSGDCRGWESGFCRPMWSGHCPFVSSVSQLVLNILAASLYRLHPGR